MSDSVSDFCDEMQRGITNRCQLLHRECRSLARQRLIIFSFAVAIAVAATGLILCGIGCVLITHTFGTAGLAELSGLGTGLVSGGFGWLAKCLRRRQAELDAQLSRYDELNYMMTYTFLINDPALRDKTVLEIAALAANQLYSSPKGRGESKKLKQSSKA